MFGTPDDDSDSDVDVLERAAVADSSTGSDPGATSATNTASQAGADSARALNEVDSIGKVEVVDSEEEYEEAQGEEGEEGEGSGDEEAPGADWKEVARQEMEMTNAMGEQKVTPVEHCIAIGGSQRVRMQLLLQTDGGHDSELDVEVRT